MVVHYMIAVDNFPINVAFTWLLTFPNGTININCKGHYGKGKPPPQAQEHGGPFD
jgi:hypothetical protein